ncbi:lamin tail domain-containing protein [Myxococcota bacterium]|nr:lamin tail domain-containing protein [Myxococcota bacterium]
MRTPAALLFPALLLAACVPSPSGPGRNGGDDDDDDDSWVGDDDVSDDDVSDDDASDDDVSDDDVSDDDVSDDDVSDDDVSDDDVSDDDVSDDDVSDDDVTPDDDTSDDDVSDDDTGDDDTTPPPEHDTLLVSEVVVTPTEGEYVEVYNPTGATVSLSGYFVTDMVTAWVPEYAQVVTGVLVASTYDFCVRFPDGAAVAPGETVVVATNAGFAGWYGLAPDFSLVEGGGAPAMVPCADGSVGTSAGISNAGEVIVLFHWDGATDRVQDVDIVLWGDKEEAVDKTGLAVDGPDPGPIASAYAADTPPEAQGIVSPVEHVLGEAFCRTDFSEAGEDGGPGGNGIAGHDETSEPLASTWRVCGAATPFEAP